MTARPAPDPGPGTNPCPDWVAPLRERAERATWSDLSAFAPPADGSGRRSAVLVLVTEVNGAASSPAGGVAPPAGGGPPPAGGVAPPAGDGPGVVLLERASTMRSHAGQVAFPGGAVDPGDADRAATALREAEEEIGLDTTSVEVLVTLPALFLPPSNFVVTPVLAFWREPHPLLRVQPAEVSSVAVVAVADLVDPVNRFTVRHPSGYLGPGFAAGGLFVWGFTAGVLDAVLSMGGWTREWDPSVVRPLPAGVFSAPSASAGNVEL